MNSDSYLCEAYDEEGRRFGSFEIHAASMSEVLERVSLDIEVKLRAKMPELRIRKLVLLRPTPPFTSNPASQRSG